MVYSDIALRSIAPYLRYDLLIESVAQGILLKELRNHRGKIWSDRVWVELGEAPLNIEGLGERYYHLWSTRRFAPLGELSFQFDGRDLHLTEVDCYHATILKQGSSLIIWTLGPQGLQRIEISTHISGSAVEKILSTPSRWETISKENFIYFHAYIKGQDIEKCYALDLKGQLHFFSFRSKSGRPRSLSTSTILYGGVRYFRPHGKGYYLIRSNGKHNIMTQGGSVVKVYPPGRSRITYGHRVVFDFEEYSFKATEDDMDIVMITEKGDHIYPTLKYPSMIPGEVYLLPSTEMLEGLRNLVREDFAPRENEDGWILGVNGSRSYILEDQYMVDYVYEKRPRYSSYRFINSSDFERDYYEVGIIW